jgi:hypothetical protein
MAEILKVPAKPRTKEDVWREFERRYLSEPFKRVSPKPKPKFEVEVTPRMAEAAKANPASVQVRVSADAADGTTVIERVRRTELIEVLEVDREGRPSLARRIDCATGERSMVEFDQGYRQQPGAVSDYNPLDALKRD